MNVESFERLEQLAGYSFKDKDLIKLAMTHSSYANEHKIDKIYNNERIEYLGDAVLELVSSEYLYENYPSMLEGDLTKLRASLVCEQSLAIAAKELGIGEFILLGKGEIQTGGRDRASVTSDAMEAFIGALFLDGGIEVAATFIKKFILNDIKNKKLFYDGKTILQEMIQGEFGREVTYHLVKESGPDHDKRFEVEARIGKEVIGKGEGKTKKAAEQAAAYEALLKRDIECI